MKTLAAVYKGKRIIELSENLDIPEDTVVLVVVPEQDDEAEMGLQLRAAVQATFAKLWDNAEDEVWKPIPSPLLSNRSSSNQSPASSSQFSTRWLLRSRT
jgi:hypothetical protein